MSKDERRSDLVDLDSLTEYAERFVRGHQPGVGPLTLGLYMAAQQLWPDVTWRVDIRHVRGQEYRLCLSGERGLGFEQVIGRAEVWLCPGACRENLRWVCHRMFDGVLDLNGSNWRARNGRAILIDAAGV